MYKDIIKLDKIKGVDEFELKRIFDKKICGYTYDKHRYYILMTVHIIDFLLLTSLEIEEYEKRFGYLPFEDVLRFCSKIL